MAILASISVESMAPFSSKKKIVYAAAGIIHNLVSMCLLSLHSSLYCSSISFITTSQGYCDFLSRRGIATISVANLAFTSFLFSAISMFNRCMSLPLRRWRQDHRPGGKKVLQSFAHGYGQLSYHILTAPKYRYNISSDLEIRSP